MKEDKLCDLSEHQFEKDAETDELNKIINIKNVKKMVENLIIASLTELKTIGSESGPTIPQNCSRLIFPQYSDGTKRISEQEARFLFVKQLETNEIYYAVEAPTKKKYIFDNNPRIADGKKGKKGQSGNIDVCLFVYNEENKKFQRKHLIEFKFGNPKQKHYSKDLLKLLCDDKDVTNYFIHIVSVQDLSKRNTKNSVEKKYKVAIGKYIKQATSKDLRFFLFNINDGRLIQYRIINNQLQPN